MKWQRTATITSAAATVDPACFDGKTRTQERCCGHAPHSPNSCLWGALLSHGYCCERSALCFAAGVLILGDDVADPVFARTGLECRHFCQSEPKCNAWTFVLPTFVDEGLHYSCWLKSRIWTAAEAAPATLRHDFISGVRHCPATHTDVLWDLQFARTLDLTQEPGSCVVRHAWDPLGFAAHASKCLHRHGWVVVRGVLGASDSEALHAASVRIEAELLARDSSKVGNRGPRRYSLGSASRTHHMVHLPEWSILIDNPTVSLILHEIYGGDYINVGGGGDLVLAETDTVQWLHVDLPRWEMYGQILPPPGIGVNFAVHNIGCQDGPMRLVPDTHTMPFQLEKMAIPDETDMLRQHGLSRVYVCPLEKGDAVLRDLRVWHAGSANRGTSTRHFPNVEFLASWYSQLTVGTEDHLAPRKTLAADVWETLSPHAQRITEHALSSEPLRVGLLEKIALPQQYD